MRRLTIIACFCLLSALAGLTARSAYAAAPAPTVSDIKPLQDWQTKNKLRLDYIGARHGLDMWIATRDTGLQLIYTTADHQAMLLEGTLIGPNSENITTDLQREFVIAHPDAAETMLKAAGGIPAPFAGATPPAAVDKTAAGPAPSNKPAAPNARSEHLWQELAGSHLIDFGAPDAPVAYMIADLTCEHCRALWVKLSPALNAGSLRIRILPIAILGKESEEAAAAALSADKPQDVWLSHVAADRQTVANPPVSVEGRTSLAANQALAMRYKLTSTPVLVYRGEADGKVKLVFGNPADMTGIWRDMGLKPAGTAGDAPADPAKAPSP